MCEWARMTWAPDVNVIYKYIYAIYYCDKMIWQWIRCFCFHLISCWLSHVTSHIRAAIRPVNCIKGNKDITGVVRKSSTQRMKINERLETKSTFKSNDGPIKQKQQKQQKTVPNSLKSEFSPHKYLNGADTVCADQRAHLKSHQRKSPCVSGMMRPEEDLHMHIINIVRRFWTRTKSNTMIM